MLKSAEVQENVLKIYYKEVSTFWEWKEGIIFARKKVLHVYSLTFFFSKNFIPKAIWNATLSNVRSFKPKRTFT